MLVYRSVKCRLTKKTLSPKTGVSLNGGTPNLPPQVMIIFSRSFPMGLLGKPTILGNPYYFPLYWLVNGDPYNGLWNNPYIPGQDVIPYITQPTRGPFFIAHVNVWERSQDVTYVILSPSHLDPSFERQSLSTRSLSKQPSWKISKSIRFLSLPKR